jgi:fatty acid desaturase
MLDEKTKLQLAKMSRIQRDRIISAMVALPLFLGAMCFVGLVAIGAMWLFDLERKHAVLIFVLGCYVVLPIVGMVFVARSHMRKAAEAQAKEPSREKSAG